MIDLFDCVFKRISFYSFYYYYHSTNHDFVGGREVEKESGRN
jgi:hypothetical protein